MVAFTKRAGRVLAAVAALGMTGGFAAQAQAGNSVLYMLSSDPWGQTSENDSLDLAFGSGNWDKSYGLSTDAFNGAYSFVYIDGGDGASTDFNNFVVNNLGAIESFVTGGGHLMLNAGRWDDNPSTLNTGFGTTLSGFSGSSNAWLTTEGLAAGLDGNGAGNGWTGGYFAHDTVGATTCLVQGDAGCVFGHTGNLYVGGQTAPYFQSSGGTQLLANELRLAANGSAGAVPEPASWAMMVGGFGLVGGAMRSRKRAVAFA